MDSLKFFEKRFFRENQGLFANHCQSFYMPEGLILLFCLIFLKSREKQGCFSLEILFFKNHREKLPPTDVFHAVLSAFPLNCIPNSLKIKIILFLRESPLPSSRKILRKPKAGISRNPAQVQGEHTAHAIHTFKTHPRKGQIPPNAKIASLHFCAYSPGVSCIPLCTQR